MRLYRRNMFWQGGRSVKPLRFFWKKKKYIYTYSYRTCLWIAPSLSSHVEGSPSAAPAKRISAGRPRCFHKIARPPSRPPFRLRSDRTILEYVRPTCRDISIKGRRINAKLDCHLRFYRLYFCTTNLRNVLLISERLRAKPHISAM